MANSENKPKITIKDQIDKFAINYMLGFHTVMLYGFAKNLGINEYLYNKAKSEEREGKIESISFSLEELSNNLKLNIKFLDAWLHMAIECGIFEVEDRNKKIVKTADYVYDLLFNRDHMAYLGDMIGVFYSISVFKDLFLTNSKTGEEIKFIDFSGEAYCDAQYLSAITGRFIEILFSKNCKKNKLNLQKEGSLLEVGCGYGLNLINWVKKYKRAKFVGIDIDPKAIKSANKLFKDENLSDRVEILEIPIEEYVKRTNTKFDIIMLNQVLHEMDLNENYRIKVLEHIYYLLKDDGLLIIGETMMPDIFDENTDHLLYDIMHKWIEIIFPNRFYTYKSFRELINLTPFKKIELIQAEETLKSSSFIPINYFWAISK